MNDEEPKPRIAFARSLARKIVQELQIKQPPVVLNDVVSHLKKSYQLRVVSSELGNVSGIQVTQADKVVIGYNSNQHPHKQRFTVAHEIGHLLLGHTHSGSDYNLKSKEPYEIEANQFAAELLMPAQLLKTDYIYGVGPKDLAQNYSVSEEAMWWRLMECRLIK